MKKLILRLGAGTTLQIIVATSAAAQQPKTYYACYVPLTGTVYRIKEADLRTGCTSALHVEFSWVDGANAVRVTDALGGDLSGVFSNASVVKLLGRALSTTPPATGQVLTFDGASWTPTTPSVAGGVTSHGSLSGLSKDDHPQYLLTNGIRTTADGFVVDGSLGVGTIPVTGPGTRLMWYPAKAAYRTGSVTGSEWNASNIGDFSFATGFNTVASGTGSFSMGQSARATGTSSFAQGKGSASGGWSFAAGENVVAAADHSFALGDYASALHAGAFLYGDGSVSTGSGSGGLLQSVAANEFAIRAAGGVRLRTAFDLSTGCNLPAGSGTWSCTSSRLAKNHFENLNGDAVLAKISAMPIQSWRYRTEPGNVRHVGPTAQDFRAAFGLGTSDEAISLVDIDGINMLGVQTLARRVNEQARVIDALRAANARQAEELQALKTAVARLERRLPPQQH